MSDEGYQPSWSYSALNAFENCPRQYHAERVLKKWPYEQSPEAAAGERMHKSMEDYINHRTPIAPEWRHLQPLADGVLQVPGQAKAEVEIVLNAAMKPVPWRSREAWVRCKIDVLVTGGNGTAFVADWKTGKSQWADTTQLKLTAALLMLTEPIDTVKSALFFTAENKAVPAVYTRDKLNDYWSTFLSKYEVYRRAHQTSMFPAKPSGLCKRCKDRECPYNRSQ